MKLVAGIDGGQSSTVAVVVDESGNVLGRGSAGPSDHVDQPPDSRRAAAACERAVAHALAAGDLPAESVLEAVVIGLSGYEGEWHGAEPRFTARRLRVVHDATIALAGAIRTRPAGVVVAGTGSVGYGERQDGEAVRVGGFGYLFGDAGSAFAIARTALAAAMDAADQGPTTSLGTAALAYFDVPDLRALARAVSLRRIDRPEIAGFARLVLDAARLGDTDARAYVGEAATALAGLAQSIARRLAAGARVSIPVALVGGVAEHPLIVSAVRARLALATDVAVVAPAHDPAVGAALLAFDEAGLPRPEIADESA